MPHADGQPTPDRRDGDHVRRTTAAAGSLAFFVLAPVASRASAFGG
jgi:hypothetical protein